MDEPSQVNAELIPFRIRVGVTGHRQIEDIPEARKAVQHALDKVFWELLDRRSAQELRTASRGNLPPVLYEVISPLAEGADRLVADVVLQIPGTVLRAVLPLTESDYLDTFTSEESREEFLRLLATHCSRPVLLRDRDLAQDSADPEIQKQIRHDAYFQAGRYVVDHSDILLALWDGKAVRGPGGTADIVKYAVSEGRPVIRLWEGKCAVVNAGKTDVRPLDGLRRYNSETLSEHLRKEREARFNRQFFGDAKDISEDARELLRKWLLPHYSRASAIANGEKTWFRRLGVVVYCLSVAAVFSVAVAVLYEKQWAFGVELALLVAVVGFLGFAKRSAPSSAWIESRVLTERIRCAAFLAICDMDASPLDVLPFMAHCHDPGSWMVRAFDEVRRQRPIIKGVPAIKELKNHLQSKWIAVQAKHHLRRSEEEQRAYDRLEWIGSLVVLIAIAAAALHWGWHVLPEKLQQQRWIESSSTVVAIVLPAVTAVLVGLQVQREHHRLAARSRSLEKQLKRIQWLMEQAESESQLRSLLVEADEFFLRESQDWLVLMRHVEIKGGG